ncbi:DUF1963 domain-containing protein [Flavivirga algicola]|uniref:DUF1963 domain-containing protein n=1 Tax=Flavivirga algicola TaxID=2729136 RepID=A0ABX1S024_9FLAO|nr:DUF1963 domain-containing protein [Flavivirga algicola]NMH87940.1 DUF1963 domain-containing protein [Flavivirga algicola]
MIDKKKHLKILKKKFDKIKWENRKTLEKSYFDFIESETVPAIKIEEEVSKKVTLGISKIGGTPHLAPHMKWPEFENAPMVFFAQLNLSDIASYHIEDLLPKRGILYFFAHYEEPVNEYGAEFDFIQPKEKYQVLFFEGDDMGQLKDTSFPETMPRCYQFKESTMRFEPFYEVPNDIYNYTEFEDNLSGNDYNRIIEFHETISKDLDVSQILGVPAAVQDDVAIDWAYAYMEEEECDEDEDELAAEFVNILTMPIFSNIGGAQGYFGIRKEDLADKNFDACIFVMQDS